MKLIQIARRNIFRNRRRSLLSMSAIAIAAMSIVLLFAILGGLSEDMGYNIQTFQTGEIRIRHAEYDRNQMLNPLHLNIRGVEALLDFIDPLEGVDEAVPRTTFPIGIFQDEEQMTGLAVGADFERETGFQDMEKTLVDGRLPVEGEREAAVGLGFAEKLGVGIGDKITFMTMSQNRSTQGLTVTVVGLLRFPYPGLNDTTLMLPIDRAQRTLRMSDAAVDVLVKIDDGTDGRALAGQINGFLQEEGYEGVEALFWEDLETSYSLILMVDTIYNFFAIFFFLLGSTVVVTTTMMVIYERMREIGTLGAMGMEGPKIVRMFFYEAAIIGFAGSLIGVVLGLIFSYVLSVVGLDFTSAMEGVDFEMSGVMYAKPSWLSAGFVFLYSFAVASAASFLPSRRASKIKPVEALRSL